MLVTAHEHTVCPAVVSTNCSADITAEWRAFQSTERAADDATQRSADKAPNLSAVSRSLLADENDELPNADVLGAAVEAYLARENPGQ